MNAENETPNIKPCPFCGGRAQPLVAFVACAIECSECEASTGPHDGIGDATVAWNRRALFCQHGALSLAAAQTVIGSQELRLAALAAEREKWQEAVMTLESERAANAVLTDELAAATAERDEARSQRDALGNEVCALEVRVAALEHLLREGGAKNRELTAQRDALADHFAPPAPDKFIEKFNARN